MSTAQPIKTWRNVDKTQFFADIFPLNQPAHLKGLVGDWPIANFIFLTSSPLAV